MKYDLEDVGYFVESVRDPLWEFAIVPIWESLGNSMEDYVRSSLTEVVWDSVKGSLHEI